MIYLRPFFIPTDQRQQPGQWGFYTVYADAKEGSCAFVNEIPQLTKADGKSFVRLIKHISEIAKAGRPWQETMDGGDCHLIEEIRIQLDQKTATTERIWQFRSKDVRVLWCHGKSSKQIILLHVFVKHKDKTPPEAIRVASRVMEQYFIASHHNKITIKEEE